MTFIHLHVYSAYSLLTGTATVKGLVTDAKKKGFSAIALTDKNVMYGAMAFYKECINQSIKPIIGVTVDIIKEMDDTTSYPLVLLAENTTGFQNLLKITSVIQTKSPHGIPIKWLRHYAKGIIALTPGLEGEIETALLNNEEDKAKEMVELYTEIFGRQNFFLATQDHGVKTERELLPRLISFAKTSAIPAVATNQVYYLSKQDAFAQECLAAIKDGVKLQDENRDCLETNEYYLKQSNEMAELFADEPDALENTINIAQRCQLRLDLHQKRLPKYPLELGINAEEVLEKLCKDGLEKRYVNPTKQHFQRLQYELSIINKMKFSDYFLIVWDFMKYAREQGILTGPGRGSAAGSIVAYVLYITDVDPIENKLLFERFLNPERISMPDIDIDFPDNRREEMIQYVAKKYGQLHVAQIITFGTFAAKAALKDVGRVFGFNPKELDKLSSFVPSIIGITLNEALKQSAPLRAFVEESDTHLRLFETAKRLEGLPRHTSIHAAGVVISEQPLVETIPIQKGHNETYLTQYSMEFLEDVGLLKMDFLGLRNLTLMDSILTAIYRKTGEKIEIQNLLLDDIETFKLLGRGNTTGVFQLESDGMRKVLTRLKPTSFEDIVAVNALYRPGPMENIPIYINRKHGREKVSYPHPDLEPILKNTYGVIIYQEQIIQIAATLAGFSLGEADLLRRAVSKKQKQVLDKERAHFVQGALKNHYNEKTANAIYDLIVKFANYGFNRSHAVAYSLIAYQLAYLKAHYQSYFMAGLLTSVIGNETKIVQYVRELQQLDIKLLPPSINKSHFKFEVENGAIRYSLAAIRGVGSIALKEIFAARRMKPFTDLFDFCLRVSSKAINRKTLESLVYSGSFDEFGHDRATLLASLDVAIEHAQLAKPEESSQIDLFADDEFSIEPKYMEVDPLTIEDKLSYEKQVLGFFLSDHPISPYKNQLLQAEARLLIELNPGNRGVKAGVYISSVKKIRTKKGDAMIFLTISDQTEEIDAVAFPAVYKRHANLFQQGAMLFIEGNIEERNGKKQFIINHAEEFSKILSKKNIQTIYLKLEADKQEQDYLNKLQAVLRRHPGSTNVILYYESLNKSVLLSEEDRVDGSERCKKELKDLLGIANVIVK